MMADLESDHPAQGSQGKAQAEKIPEETISPHLRLILGTGTAYNGKIKNSK